MKVADAQAAYDQIAWKADVGTSQEAADLWQATTNYEQAKAEYQRGAGGGHADEISPMPALRWPWPKRSWMLCWKIPIPTRSPRLEAKVVQAQAELERLLAGASARGDWRRRS